MRGSLIIDGTLEIPGSLTIAGTLMYYGYGRGPCRHKLTARLVSPPPLRSVGTLKLRGS
jgi:hypothetical protein